MRTTTRIPPRYRPDRVKPDPEPVDPFLDTYQGDPATGIFWSTVVVMSFGAGLFCGLLARAIWLLFHSFHLHS